QQALGAAAGQFAADPVEAGDADAQALDEVAHRQVLAEVLFHQFAVALELPLACAPRRRRFRLPGFGLVAQQVHQRLQAQRAQHGLAARRALVVLLVQLGEGGRGAARVTTWPCTSSLNTKPCTHSGGTNCSTGPWARCLRPSSWIATRPRPTHSSWARSACRWGAITQPWRRLREAIVSQCTRSG